MSVQVYLDHILQPIVLSWLLRGESFILEEDNDSGHGGSDDNIVRSWKEAPGLRSCFHCPGSPDRSPIEHCWLPPTRHMTKYPHGNEHSTRKLIQEGWAEVSPAYMNQQVVSMPPRWKDVIRSEGPTSGYSISIDDGNELFCRGRYVPRVGVTILPLFWRPARRLGHIWRLAASEGNR
jgi:hypothetical protein